MSASWLNGTSAIRFLLGSASAESNSCDGGKEASQPSVSTAFIDVLFISSAISIFVFIVISLMRKLQTKTTAIKKHEKEKELEKQHNEFSSSDFAEGLPTYTATEISEHGADKPRLWVSYKRGVYDVTDFLPKHPGGKILLLAAGQAIEPFWAMYTVHYKPYVSKLLEKYRIGNLHENDIVSMENDSNSPFKDEPVRDNCLIQMTARPYNAEAPEPLLVENFITPIKAFYVRNHLPVPLIDPETYRLEVTGIGIEDKSFTLEELKKFPKHKVVSTIMCSGNRRQDMNKIKTVKAVNWSPGAVGTAEWAGAKMFDVLESIGFDAKTNPASHVQFEGSDADTTNIHFGASISMRMAKMSDVTLAYEMNGEPIPRDHGFPIRAVVPGVAGVRNVKWLRKIILADEESRSHWQRAEYKGFSPSVNGDTVIWSSAPAVTDMPVTSAICFPQDGVTVKLIYGKLPLKGYAWSGGGRKIIRVDITADQGKIWHTAELESGENSGPAGWAWTLWAAQIPIEASKSKEVEVWSKAVDDAYNSQPESTENIWNMRGIASNAYHKVKVRVR